MQTVVLSRRNLLTLLAKLDKVKAGGSSELTIVKQDTVHPKYPCSDVTVVQAVEDKDYYTDREPGYVLDAPAYVIAPETGLNDPEILDAANNHGQCACSGLAPEDAEESLLCEHCKNGVCQ